MNELVHDYQTLKILMSCPHFIEFIDLISKYSNLISDHHLISDHNDIQRKIISKLYEQSRQDAKNFSMGLYPLRKNQSTHAITTYGKKTKNSKEHQNLVA